MNWIKTTIDLGRVKEKTKIDFMFESKEELDITTMKPGCGGCTSLGVYKDKKLPVTFKADSIPKHLIHKKHQVVSKTIYVFYRDGNSETLTFKATVIL